MSTENLIILDEQELLAASRSQSTGWDSNIVFWLSNDNAWLKRRCAARLGSVADAEDAMQDITIKVLRSIGRFEGRSALRTWVTRIADNHCTSLLRNRTAKAMTNHL